MAWDASGNPVLSTVPLATPAAMQQLYSAAAALTFECPDPKHPDHRFHGMSLAEVIVRKQIERAASGIGDDEKVLDRLMGKPKQKTEQLRVNISYEEFLRDVASKTGGAPPPDIVDAEVVKP